MRGIMIYSNEITPKNAEGIVRQLYNLGFTDIFYIVKNIDGKVFYSSKIAEVVEDRLGFLCQLADRYKMGVYAWFCTFTEGYEGKLFGNGVSRFLRNNQECAAINRNGVTTLIEPVPSDQGLENYVCPANPRVQEYELELMREIVNGYPVKGIHLDFIRYPFPGDYCYCEFCQQKFKQDFGIPLQSKEANRYFLPWRQSIITDFVNKSCGEVKRLNKAVQISALVWKYNDCLNMTQNWKQWNIDFVTPMFYHKSYKRKISWIGQEINRNFQISNKNIIPAVGGPYSNLFTKKEWNSIEKVARSNQCKGILYGHYGLLDVVQTLERGGLSDIWKLIMWKYLLYRAKGLQMFSKITPNVIKQRFIKVRGNTNDGK